MNYSVIENLPNKNEINNLHSAELDALGQLWIEKKGELEKSDEYQEFIKKMQREWAIETGIIERLYTWNRGVTEVLIKQGVDSSLISYKSGINRDKAENISNIIKDQEDIVEGLFSHVKGEQPFSEHFIRSMHQKFTAHQNYTQALTPNGELRQIPLLKGQYKEHSNNPKRPDGDVHEYCPPELVTDEMQQLIKMYNESEEAISPEILSAWLHHRFTQIHPFQDGNGRIARAIASLIFLKKGLFPLVVRDIDRKEYIGALEKADKGDITRLVRLFAKRQRDSILSALGIQQQVEKSKHSKQIIFNTLALLRDKSLAHNEQLNTVYDVADKLQKIATSKLNELQISLDSELRSIETQDKSTYNASVKQAKAGEEESYYFYHEIIEIANLHDYYANVDRHKSWSRIVIYTQKIFEIVFAIHGHGYGNNGVMVATGFTFEKIPSEDSRMESTNTKSTHQDIFQFNYLENEESTVKRFNEWLEESLTIALAEWQRTVA
jgi:Fic family protein